MRKGRWERANGGQRGKGRGAPGKGEREGRGKKGMKERRVFEQEEEGEGGQIPIIIRLRVGGIEFKEGLGARGKREVKRRWRRVKAGGRSTALLFCSTDPACFY